MLKRAAEAVARLLLVPKAEDNGIAVGVPHRECFRPEKRAGRRQDFNAAFFRTGTDRNNALAVPAGEAGIAQLLVLALRKEHAPQRPLTNPITSIEASFHHVHRVRVKIRKPRWVA